MQKTKATRRARALLDRRPRRVQGRAGKDKASELRRISRKKQHAGLAKGERGGGRADTSSANYKEALNSAKNEELKQQEAGTSQGEHQAQQRLCTTPGPSPEEGAKKT